MKNKFHWIVMVIMANSVSTVSRAGEVVPLEEVWRKIEVNSPSRKAAEEERGVAQIGADRTGRHWFPMLYVSSRVYSTNDPGLSLFSTLGQREMTPADFSPERVNYPGTLMYEQVTLGLNWPLFEGGLRLAEHSAAERMKSAKEMQANAVTVQIYSEAAKVYGTMVAEVQRRREMQSLAGTLDQVISKYRIGAKENPVGYSGLLGLRNVKNRIVGALVESESKVNTLRIALDKMAKGLPVNWEPKEEGTEQFVQRYLATSNAGQDSSYQVESLFQMAQAVEASRNAERAKFLPKIGLFAEGSLNAGNRNAATSYIAGAFLQWDLFVAPNMGAVRQAEHSAAAAEAHAEEARLHESIESEGSRQAALALESNLKILDDSSALLSEQTQVAKKLFLSGAINALQLAEVLNRRLDLISSFAEAKTQYLAVKATTVKNSKFSISTENGVSHE